MPQPPRVGLCRGCLGWGELHARPRCAGCATWRQTYPGRAPCRRCRHDGHLNPDGLCRLCLLAIRTDDPGWIVDPRSGVPCQLGFLLPGVRIPYAQPLNKLQGRPRTKRRAPSWVATVRLVEPADDPRVCPPTLPGQLALMRLPRRLTGSHPARIRDRELRDYPKIQTLAKHYATERGHSGTWRRRLCQMLRLALAVRDADGEDLVREETLDDLPAFSDAAALILRRADLLPPPRHSRSPHPRPGEPRSCRHCQSWGVQTLCDGCRGWRDHPVGRCARCRRAGLPVLDELCRGCCLAIDEHGSDVLAEPWTQLWLGGPFAPRLHSRAGALGYQPTRWRARQREVARRSPPPPVSPHLLTPGQAALFDTRRDWSRVGVPARLPSLTAEAQALLDRFQQHAHEHGWNVETTGPAARSLRILVAWLGVDAPIPEADIRALPSSLAGTTAQRVLQFLAEHDLVIPDPLRQVTADERFIEQHVQALPEGIAEEVRRWVQVLRGEGRRAHALMPLATIRNYLGYAYPVLRAWSGRIGSLREITADDIRDTMRGRTGTPAQSLLTALRSLFKALKQERLIFRDPSRGISLATGECLPVPIPTDRLRGLIDQAGSPMARFVVALIAIHGLGVRDVRLLRSDDLDLASGRLVVRRDGGHHTVYLDELTHRMALAWLRERRRWPVTTNPHLLVTGQSATHNAQPPVSRTTLLGTFQRLGLQPSKLRQDRILDEARHTADPVHLMRVFGISAATAMRYVYTAHPERRSALSR